MRGRITILKAAALFAALSARGAIAADGDLPEGFDFSGTRGRYVVMLNIDALNERTFHSELAAGRLPNIARVLREKDGHVGRLVSSFPSSSTPAIPEIFSGRYLDRSETLPRKVHAFDRRSGEALRYTFKNRAWDDDQHDIWDICAAGGLRTMSFYLTSYDGMSETHFRQKYLAWDSLFEFLKMSRVMNFDKKSLKDAARAFRTAPEMPRLTYIWCDTLDVGGHIYGPYSEQYERGLRDIDRAFGWVVAALRARPLPPTEGQGSIYDRTTFVIHGDHGLSESRAKVGVGRFLRRERLEVRDTSHVRQFLSEYVGTSWAAKVDAILVPGGSTVAELYLRARGIKGGRRPWTERMTRFDLEHFPTPRHPRGIDLLRAIAAMPGMDVVLVKEQDGRDRVVRVASASRGQALVMMRDEPGNDTYAYVPIDGGDPLQYRDDDLARSLVTPPSSEPIYANARTWLLATLGTSHPFAVPRIPRAVGRHDTESDVILVARPGFDFLARSRGDHGGLDPETMFTPLVVAGPGATSAAPLCTTVDMLPMLLDMLGVRAPASFSACLDGRPPVAGAEVRVALGRP